MQYSTVELYVYMIVIDDDYDAASLSPRGVVVAEESFPLRVSGHHNHQEEEEEGRREKLNSLFARAPSPQCE